MLKTNHALAVGFFVLALLLLALWSVYWLGNLEKDRDVYVIATNGSVAGLNPESTVFYRGLPVGKVLRLYFDQQDQATILIDIEVDRGLQLTHGLYATLRLKGVTGLTQIDLQDSGNNPETLRPGREVANRVPLLPSITDKLLESGHDILSIAMRLMMQAEKLLSDDNQLHIQETLVAVHQASERLLKLESHLDDVLLKVPSALDQAGLTLQAAQKAMQQVEHLSLAIQALTPDVRQTLTSGATFLAQGEQIAGHIQQRTLPGLDQALHDLSATLMALKQTASSVRQQPQAFLYGAPAPPPAPGEAGFQGAP
ncbi:MAG: MlaD family protein [Methylococcales bacterium]|nr:MlaD family protein [Methylococcales bacterium]